MKSVLIVDDEKHTRDGMAAVLADNYDVFAAANADEAISMLDAEHFDAVITDLRMSGKSGMSVIDKTISLPDKPVCIMLTAYGNVEMAVEAMKRGASDFLSKPIDVDKLESVLKAALEKRDADRANAAAARKSASFSAKEQRASNTVAPSRQDAEDTLPHGAEALGELGTLIAKSDNMKRVIAKAEQVAHSKATVMLTGETGTGKEMIARLIHNSSPRRDGAFLAVHCAAIPATLLESELFGYEKGAFTGANQRRIGRFEAADNGTIFLDEIGEIDSSTQVKLLRFLETHSFERVGGLKNIDVNVRLICATNRDLKKMCAEGTFREDLYYRLNVVEINIPPLREHKQDIPPLLDAYMKYYAAQNETRLPALSPETLEILKKYPWPGNIRELRNFCENTVVMASSDVISPADLDAKFLSAPAAPSSDAHSAQHTADGEKIPLSKKENEALLIRRALEEADGNKSKAAELLGISRRTLHRKLANMPEIK